MISKKELKNNTYFFFISALKKFVSIKVTDLPDIEELIGIDLQKKIILKNTISFSQNKACNNILFWGAKGMGKSTLILSTIKFLNLKKEKINLLEVLSSDIKDLPEILYQISKLNEKFIIFIDDISLKINSNDFKTLKVLLEGSLLSYYKNIIFYTTSNARHIIKPIAEENINEIQLKDQRNNIISLSDRFGLWVGFHKCNQKEYIKIVNLYAKKYMNKFDKHELEKKAKQWSVERGDFSGRIAHQFILANLKK